MRLPVGFGQQAFLTGLTFLAWSLKTVSSDCDENFELVYTAFGAQPVRSNDTYTVKVFTEDIADATLQARRPEFFNYTFSITCTDYYWNPIISYNSTPIILSPGTIQDVSIPVKNVLNDYSCHSLLLMASFKDRKNNTEVIRPINSLSRQNSYEQNITTIMIQTDKPIYKPGDTLKFRVLVLNQRLFPYNDPNVTVVITDSQSNILKRWINIERIDGVFSSSMVISTDPNLGDWEITATTTNLVEKAKFSVDEYILPRFKVELKHSSYIYRSKPNISIEVNGLYTSGKGLTGNATITLDIPSYYWMAPISKNITVVNGIAVAEFDPLQVYYYPYNGQIYRIRANVTEKLSGFTRSATSTFTYYDREFKIENNNKLRNFKKGLPHIFQLKISKPDNTPVSDTSQNSVRIEGCRTTESNSTVAKFYTLTPEGTVWIECLPATPDAYYTYISASYKNTSETIYLYENYDSNIKSDSGIRMQISLSQTNASVGENVTISVKANLPVIQNLNYFLIGKQTFVGQGRIVVPEKPKSSVSMTITVPEFEGSSLRIFVFFREGGKNELIQDNIYLYKKQKFLTVSVNATECQPGDSITVNFQTRQPTSSLLAIRAIDQSVLLLNNKDWDITESTASQKRPQISNYRNSYTYNNIKDEFTNANVGVLLDHMSKLRFLELMENSQYSQFQYSRNLDADGEITLDENDEKSHVRSNFPETWLWEEMRTNGTNTTLVATLPDTITSWMITGFSLSSKNGLEVMQSPQILTVKKEFYLGFNLPYVVIRKKAFALEVYVFNYLDTEVEADVTLDNTDGHYQFVDSVEREQTKVTKTIKIPANQANGTSFVIIPMRADSMNLNVSAKTNSHSDEVYQTVNVIPEGIKKTETKNFFIDVNRNKSFDHTFALNFPKLTVRGADQIKISVTGDLLGNALENLNSMILLPQGCGEQTLSKFVPDIVILNYLNSTGRLTQQLQKTIKEYLEFGYANLLGTSRRTDGSFSIYGNGDTNPSTWLTALLVKHFVQASTLITIDELVIERAVDFLLTVRNNATGAFVEKGTSLRRGGSFETGAPITAHVVLAIMEFLNRISVNSTKHAVLTQSLTASLTYISNEAILASNDSYVIAICAYALQLSNHSSKDAFFNKLKSLAVNGTTDYKDPLKYWNTTEDNPTYVSPLRIEVASFAALTYIHRGELLDARPIIKYILIKRNNLGGFLSSQDTLMGITAITAYATKTFVKDMNMSITTTFGGTTKKQFLLGKDSDVFEQFIIKGSSKSCKLAAQGQGSAFVQITWSYYISEDLIPSGETNSSFIITTKVTTLEAGNAVELSVCSKTTLTYKTDMAMVEVLLPVNYGFDQEDLQSVRGARNVKRVELKLGGAKLNVYYDYLSSVDSCFTMIATQNFATADVRLATIKAYEYNGVAQTTVYAKLPRITVCDICKEHNCDAKQCAARKR